MLATVTIALRSQRRTDAGAQRRLAPPARLRSVRVQCPQPTVVEVAAHVQLSARSSAMAFRLQAWYDRWLCTALDLGPGALGT